MIKKIVFLLPILLYAIVPSDDEYYVHKGEQATIIYTEEYAYEAQIAAAKWQRLQKIYENEFRYKPNAVFLTLSSKKNQIANAVTFSVPLLGMEFYSAGAQMINYFGYKDWIEILLAHEGAHIYQLDNKGDIPQLAQTALGRNTAPIFVGILPIFTLPNIFLPDLLLEGNAVYNESRITAAGRLYQSRHKALFMTLLKADLLTDDRILNNHILFPYMEEKYIVGGFFFELLDRRFGNGRTNSFFALHGDRWINPFLVDLSFKEHFGEGFYTLFDAF
ncbi:MAG: hypothetical protein LBN32_01270, partial [Helicobacteraceae bacterium]|nr:hypothetical protein [Helicobacteraceae bacterium]